VHGEIRAPLLYLPEYLRDEPMRVLRAWWDVRRRPGYRSAVRAWLQDLWRDRTASRWRRFGQALVLSHEVPSDVVRLHAHFLHTPSSVVRYAAMVCGLPWSGSAHAKDIWTSPAWELREKLADCDWLVTCTRTNRDYLATLSPPGRVELVYHGLDLRRFPIYTLARVPRAPGSSAAATFNQAGSADATPASTVVQREPGRSAPSSARAPSGPFSPISWIPSSAVTASPLDHAIRTPSAKPRAAAAGPDPAPGAAGVSVSFEPSGGEQAATDDDIHPYLPRLAALMAAYTAADKDDLAVILYLCRMTQRADYCVQRIARFHLAQ
jgi:hypothetical protein